MSSKLIFNKECEIVTFVQASHRATHAFQPFFCCS